jgi:hypothetical protein
MNLRALAEWRAAQNPEGPVVADDSVNLNNIEFLQAALAAKVVSRNGQAYNQEVLA